jgi:hypothetical protein
MNKLNKNSRLRSLRRRAGFFFCAEARVLATVSGICIELLVCLGKSCEKIEKNKKSAFRQEAPHISS